MITIKTKHPNHSVKEAVVAFFVQGMLSDAERFRALVDELGYNSFDVINNNNIQLTLRDARLQNVTKSVAKGFRMSKFTNGNMSDAIQSINQGNQLFTFNSLYYNCWSEFKENVEKCAKGVCGIEDHPVVAFSLQYIVEFMTEGETKYDAKEIFNTDSSFLSRDFFSAYNVNYKMSLEQHDDNNGRYNQDTAIVVKHVGNHAMVTLTNSFTFVTDDEPVLMSQLIRDKSFHSRLESAHTKIKQTLADVLSRDMCKRINLVLP